MGSSNLTPGKRGGDLLGQAREGNAQVGGEVLGHSAQERGRCRRLT